MEGGATETYEHMPDNWRIKQVLEMGGLLPFLANHEGDQASSLWTARGKWTPGGSPGKPLRGPTKPRRDASVIRGAR